MNIFSRLFSRRQDNDDLVESHAPEKADPSKAREDYYADLEAQASATQNHLFGTDDPDALSEEQRVALVKKIMPRTIADVRVVSKGDDIPVPSADGKVATEDAAPTGAIQGDGLTPEQRALLRNADLYQVYARINPRILRHFVSRAFIGYPACTILGQHEVIGLCCAMPAEDAIAPGFTLSCVSEDHKKDDKHIQTETTWLELMQQNALDDGVDELCIKFGTYKRLYGIGIAIPRVKLTEGHTFEEPYDPSFIEEGSFKGFTVIDPSRIAWDFDANTLFDPLSEWYQKPEFLRLVTQTSDVEGLGAERRMHRSWVITSNYREVGEDLLSTYMYGGQPLPQILYERVFCADTLANEIIALAMSKRTVVMDVNLKELMMQPKKIENLIKRVNYYRTNNSIYLKDIQQQGQVMQLETSLTDLQPLSSQQFQYCAAYAGIPMTKLFKNVPSGLQATGQYEVEDYEQTIKPIRKDNVRLLNRYFEMKIHSDYPDRSDLQIKVVFNPFISPKAAEVQQIASQKASMVCQLMMNNVITATEGRALLKRGESDVFDVISPKMPPFLAKIEEMKDPEKAQQMQMQAQMEKGGMGGMPGQGGAPGAMPGQPPAEPQMVTENKGVFAEAWKEVLSDSPAQGGASQEGGAEQPPQPQEAAAPAPEAKSEETPPEAAGKPQQPDLGGVFANAVKETVG